jgi:hypothetical protein
MIHTFTAANIGDNPRDFTGSTVEFNDFHGRTILGILESATNPPTAAYATLKVGGRDRAVFKNTPVQVSA